MWLCFECIINSRHYGDNINLPSGGELQYLQGATCTISILYQSFYLLSSSNCWLNDEIFRCLMMYFSYKVFLCVLSIVQQCARVGMDLGSESKRKSKLPRLGGFILGQTIGWISAAGNIEKSLVTINNSNIFFTRFLFLRFVPRRHFKCLNHEKLDLKRRI